MSAATRTPAYRAARLLLGLAAALTVLAMHGTSSNHLLAMPMSGSTAVAMAADGPGPHRLDPAGGVSSADRIAMLRNGSGLSSRFHPDCLATRRADPLTALPVALDVVAPASATSPATTMRAAPRSLPKPSLDRLGISRT